MPVGIHEAADWQELVDAFGWNDYRLLLLSGLRAALLNLQAAGCRRVWVDGSFVTDKEAPGDIDVLWAVTAVDDALLDPVFMDLAPPRAAQKAKYGAEFFPVEPASEDFRGWINFFEKHKETGLTKGLVALSLGGLT